MQNTRSLLAFHNACVASAHQSTTNDSTKYVERKFKFFDCMKDNVHKLETQVACNTHSISDINSRISNLGTLTTICESQANAIMTLQNSIGILQTQSQTDASALQSLSNKLTSIELSMSAINNAVNAHEASIANLDTCTESQKKSIAYLKALIVDLNSKIVS